MKIEQMRCGSGSEWRVTQSTFANGDAAHLLLVFVSPNHVDNARAFEALSKRYPGAHIVGGSTAGNILDVRISDDDMVATAIHFEKSRIKLKTISGKNSEGLGERVSAAAHELLADDLRYILVLSDGLNVNGSVVAQAVNIDERIPVIGGLMGDNADFKHTYVIADGPPMSDQIVLVGFYGEALRIGHGCFAGWNEFGVDRVITRSVGNVVYQIDDQPALALYKSYLGEFAEGLPGVGLRFPLSIRFGDGIPLIRTLLSVNEEEQSLTFAGDVPEGAAAQLMKGNVDTILDGAAAAAEQARMDSDATGLSIIISCVGRRMVMDQMADEELDSVREMLGKNIMLTGFYSYGELAPYNKEFWKCQLHNQTMTLVTMSED